MAKNFSVALSLLLNSSQYTQALKGAANATQGFRGQLVKAFAPIVGFTAIIATVTRITNTIYEQTKKLDSLSAGYKSVITDSDELQKTYQRLNDVADKYGISVSTLKEEYLGFAAASKGTALEGEKAWKVYTSLISAMSKLGASEEVTHRALIAVTQMMSKGTIASEELRGQLGEALPGAFNMMAQGLGVSTQELGKMLKAGEVLASDALPKLATQLDKTFGTDYKIDTLTAAQGRFSTAITEAIKKLEAGDLFKGLVNGATAFIKIIAGTATGTDYFEPLFQKVQKLIDYFKILTPTIAGAFAVKSILSFIGGIQATNNKIKLLQETIKYNDRVWNGLSDHFHIQESLDPKFKPSKEDLNIQKEAGRESSKARRELELMTTGTSRLSKVMSMLSPIFVTAGLALAAWVLNATGVVSLTERMYDDFYGLSNVVKKYGAELATEQANVSELTARLKGLSVGSEEYKNIVGQLVSKYPSLNKYLNENTGELKLNEKAQKALNDEILRGVNAKGLAERKAENAVFYGKSVGNASGNLLDMVSSPTQRGELLVKISEIQQGLRDATITAEEAKKTISEFLGVKDIIGNTDDEFSVIAKSATAYGKVSSAIDEIAFATKRLNEENRKAEEAFPVIPLSKEEQAAKDKAAAEKAAKEKADADALAREKHKQAIEEQSKASKEAYEKELAKLKEFQNLQQVVFDEMYLQDKISKEEHEIYILRLTRDSYKAQLEAAKKYKQDISGIKTQISESEIALKEKGYALMYPVTQLKENTSDMIMSNPEIGEGHLIPKLKDRFFSADDNGYTKKAKRKIPLPEKEAIQQWVDDANQAFANFSANTVVSSFDAIAEAAFGVGDGFENFGFKALESMGSFLEQLGEQLITTALLYGAFDKLVKNPQTWPAALAIGIAAVAAGAAFKAMGAKGIQGNSGGSGGSVASNSGNYSSDRNKDSKVIFEIKGSTLVGVLDNYKKRDSNFR